MKYKITDLFELKMGKTPSRSNPNYWNGTNVWLSVSDLSSSGKYISCSKERITEQAIDKSKIQMIPKDTVVMSFKLSLGKVSITTHNMYTNEAIIAFVDKKSEKVDPSYLYYWCLSQNWEKYGNKAVMGVTLNKKTLTSLSIELPPYELQKRIVKRLDLLANLLEAKNIQLQSLQQLVQSRFNELFINKNQNDKESLLKDVASLMSGITKGRRIKGPTITVPYMAVSNVKDGYLDLSTIKTIEASEQEVEKYRLLPNDVLMTEGGDPDKLGRGCVIETPLHNCIHQNHIFRVRLNNRLLTPTYFQFYLQDKKAREYFLRSAKQTTGIASLNMTQLRNLPVIIPPIGQQLVFEEDVQVINKSKFICLINA